VQERLEGLLEIVSLEMTMKDAELLHVGRAGGREFQILGAV